MLGEGAVRDAQEKRGADDGATKGTGIMTEAIRVLRREHANMAALVKTLEWQLAEFEAGGTPDYDVIRSVIDYFLRFPDLYHHPKEDLVFGRLKERAPAVAERIGNLRREHEVLGARTRELSAGLKAVLDEAQVPRESFLRWARAFIDLQSRHMQTEETTFFPAALEWLVDDDWKQLQAAMTTPEDPLFGERVGERFEHLHKSILQWQEEHQKSGRRK